MLPTIDNEEIQQIYNFLIDKDAMIEVEKEVRHWTPIYDEETGELLNPFESKIENLNLKFLGLVDDRFYYIIIEGANPRWISILLKYKFPNLDKYFVVEYYKDEFKVTPKKLYFIFKTQVYANGNFDNNFKKILDKLYDWIVKNSIKFKEINGQIFLIK